MEKQLGQRGFHLWLIPLLIILVGIIGFTGWYVWDAQKDKNVETSENADIAITPTPTPTESQQYMEIVEWGVKLPLLAGFEDLRYTWTQVRPNDEEVALEKASIADMYNNPNGEDFYYSSCSGHLGSLIRYTNPQTTGGPSEDTRLTYGEIFPDAYKIGNYYYAWVHPTGACGPKSYWESDEYVEASSIEVVIEGIVSI